MGNIIINVAELICESPIVTHSEFTGTNYIFNVDWTSKGNEYSLFDPTIKMMVSIQIYSNIVTPPTLEFNGVIDTNAPFNVNGYTIDIKDYYADFSSKYDLYLVLSLISEASCNNATVYKFPINYP